MYSYRSYRKKLRRNIFSYGPVDASSIKNKSNEHTTQNNDDKLLLMPLIGTHYIQYPFFLPLPMLNKKEEEKNVSQSSIHYMI